MDIIPVLDIMNGVVVHAAGGDRARFAPIVTPLASSTEPARVAAGICAVYPFQTFYLADLDGIAGRGRNTDLVDRISDAAPGAALWIDAGTASRGAARAVLAAPSATMVVGTESLESMPAFVDIMAEAPERTVLSLDFRGEEFLGPPALLARASLWPSRVICMTLSRVGSDQGPDLARIHEIAARAGAGRKVYAAGGIRGRQDLEAARSVGAGGALIASSLHSGKISAGDLEMIAGR